MTDRDTSNQSSATTNSAYLPWLLALGTGLAGFSFGASSREGARLEFLREPPTLTKAVEFPENAGPGIALIHVREDALKNVDQIVKEFERVHSNLEVIFSSPGVEVIPNSEPRHLLKVQYRLRSE